MGSLTCLHWLQTPMRVGAGGAQPLMYQPRLVPRRKSLVVLKGTRSHGNRSGAPALMAAQSLHPSGPETHIPTGPVPFRGRMHLPEPLLPFSCCKRCSPERRGLGQALLLLSLDLEFSQLVLKLEPPASHLSLTCMIWPHVCVRS